MKIRVRVSGYQQAGQLARRFRAAADGGLQRDVAQELQRAGRPVLATVKARVLTASFPADKAPKRDRTEKSREEIRQWAEQAQATKRRRKAERRAGVRGPAERPAPLRAALAAATHSKPMATGVRLYVEGSEVGRESRGHRLAKLTDTELAPRWRHPVHDNREVWVTQHGQPWFFAPIRAAEPQFRAGVRRGMDKTARRILGG